MKRLISLNIIGLLMLAGCSYNGIDEPAANDATPEQELVIPADAIPGIAMVKMTQEVPAFSSNGMNFEPSLPRESKFAERHRAAGLSRWYVVTFDSETPLTKAGSDIFGVEGVEKVEFISPVRSTDLPFNDSYLNKQWHYHNDGSGNYRTEGSDINVFEAWKVTTGRPDVIVAVIDGGVEYTHEDLAANMWVNEAEANGLAGVDDDNNGYIDDIYGYNFCAENNKAIGKISVEDHGTHIAGTIAAVNNNGKGVSGIAGGNGSSASGVRIMSAQTSDNSGHGAYIQSALVYAADNGAVLGNCSWALQNQETTPSFIAEAINYFNRWAGYDENEQQVGPMDGGLLIFAAGNEDAQKSAPPCMDPEVFTVAAIGADFKRAYYSNYGDWVDICAPGGDAKKDNLILSTLTGNDYGFMQGTSMAAPHVTGVAALVVSKFGTAGFTRQNLIDILTGTSNPKVKEYNNLELGAGLVDAYAAVTYSESAPRKVVDIVTASTGDAITITFPVLKDSEGATPGKFSVYLSEHSLAGLDEDNPGEDVSVTVIENDRSAEKVTLTVNGLKFKTRYYIRIGAQSLLGTRAPLSDEIAVETKENSKPVITPLDGISMKIRSHATGVMRFEVSDADGHKLSYKLTEFPAGVRSTMTDNVVNVTIDAPKFEEGKTYDAVLTVSDPFSSTEQAFSFIILNNVAPVVKTPIENVVMNKKGISTTIDMSKYFEDEDGETLTYQAVEKDGGNAVTLAQSGSSLVISGSKYGSSTITVTASDARKKSVSQDFQVLVRDGSKVVDLYPVPVKDVLNVRTGEEMNIGIKIYGKSGALVYSSDSAKAAPFNPFKVDMTTIPGGQYTVKIDNKGKQETFQIVKQ